MKASASLRAALGSFALSVRSPEVAARGRHGQLLPTVCAHQPIRMQVAEIAMTAVDQIAVS